MFFLFQSVEMRGGKGSQLNGRSIKLGGRESESRWRVGGYLVEVEIIDLSCAGETTGVCVVRKRGGAWERERL